VDIERYTRPHVTIRRRELWSSVDFVPLAEEAKVKTRVSWHGAYCALCQHLLSARILRFLSNRSGELV